MQNLMIIKQLGGWEKRPFADQRWIISHLIITFIKKNEDLQIQKMPFKKGLHGNHFNKLYCF